MRADGRIPADAVVEVTNPEEPTTLADVVDDHAERQAITAEITDEEWLAGLPLSAKLSGQCLQVFGNDALRFRNIARARDALRYASQRLEPKDSRKGGAYSYLLSRFLRIESPDRWLLCPKPTDGGCGGSGTNRLTGNCPKCHGRGYWIK